MIPIGGQQGVAYNGRQGVQNATVLTGGGDAAALAIRQRQIRDQLRSAAAAKKKAEMSAAAAKLKEVTPDFFFAHQAQMSKSVMDHVNAGAELLANGIDPFTSPSQQATDWRKQQATLAMYGESSKQIKDWYFDLQKKINGADESEYDPDSIIAANEYIKTPLSEIVAGQKAPPVLLKRTTDINALGEIGKVMSQWTQSLNGQQASETELRDFLTSAITEPSVATRFQETYSQKLAMLDPDEINGLRRRAFDAGVELWQQAAYEDALKWQKRKQPFDAFAAISKAAGEVSQGLDLIQTSNGYVTRRRTSGKDAESGLASAARALVYSDPRWIDYYSETMPQESTETDKKYKARVIEQLIDDMRPLVKKLDETSMSQAGASRRERQDAQDKFLRDMRSGDNTLMTAAAQFLEGTKLPNNVTLTTIRTTPGLNGVSVEFSTPLELIKTQADAQQIADAYGVKMEKYEPLDGKIYGWLGMDSWEVTNQKALGLYNLAADQKSREYETKFSERSPKTVKEAEVSRFNILQPIGGNKRNNDDLFKN